MHVEVSLVSKTGLLLLAAQNCTCMKEIKAMSVVLHNIKLEV